MSDQVKNDAKQKMAKSIEALKNALAKLRTGRAHPSLLDQIRVDYYGTQTALSQVASVAVESARCLAVTPWEKTMVAPIEKAIMTSNLGLNPNTAGTVIRIPLPPLTEERRRDLAKIVKEEAEKARISVRNIRRDANAGLKELLKTKDISEDDDRRLQTEIQKVTDDHVAQIDKLAAEKESELMVV